MYLLTYKFTFYSLKNSFKHNLNATEKNHWIPSPYKYVIVILYNENLKLRIT